MIFRQRAWSGSLISLVVLIVLLFHLPDAALSHEHSDKALHFHRHLHRHRQRSLPHHDHIESFTQPGSELENTTASLHRRDDYTCGPGKPCGNGACCGKSGNCGYGPDYCGKGCLSNCDAHAECGRYAKKPGKTCPLNVCCSQHGFCGTTKDYCDKKVKKCQSNCEEHPKPPSGSSTGKALSKVIGYYEAWNARSKCHETKPKDLPLNALTHVNYAFAYIEPRSLQITTMDAKTPGYLFNDVTDLKWYNPDLEVWLSLGGWTFSDNNTDTQPVFGNIARSATLRKAFASNLLHFMNTYGFDGVDIDWEYPGAPDRGGKPDDTKNFVLLMKQVRETFDNSGQKLGISFTIPSSYWYLKWFDLPGLMKYADWTNLMSYDLHGVWDRDNPIGSIVQGHTNLTEIKLAAELLWRNDIKPSQVALGFGFYGRAFTLQDSSCTKPGCPFRSGAKKGPCTDTSGYLAYYEVQDILKKNPKIKPVHDKEAAVKYMTWDKDQWISYDDADTFKQKIEWANKMGFSGSLIWASDLDDYDWTAHEAMLNKKISKKLDLHSDPNIAQKMESWEWDGEFGQKCYRTDDCTDLDNPQVSTCSQGYSLVGFDARTCNWQDKDGKRYGRMICCEKESLPDYCVWRGGTGRAVWCNGQCHEGESTLFSSKSGGQSWRGDMKDESSTKKCAHGDKVFCCGHKQFTALTEDCQWTDCGKYCQDDETEVAYAMSIDDYCWPLVGQRYCCKLDGAPKPLNSCHWVGKGDCADNKCDDTDVTLLTDENGDGDNHCFWGRKSSLCCEPNKDYLEDTGPTMCDETSACQHDQDLCDEGDFFDEDDPWRGDTDDDADDEADLDKRAVKPVKRIDLKTWLPNLVNGGRKLILELAPAGYRSTTEQLRWTLDHGIKPVAYRMYRSRCTGMLVRRIAPAGIIKAGSFIAGYDMEAEHPVEAQIIAEFLEACVTGVLPGKQMAKTLPIDPAKLVESWRKEGEMSFPGIGPDNFQPKTPNDWFYNAVGSKENPGVLAFLEKDLNKKKGSIFALERGLGDGKIDKLIKRIASDGPDKGRKKLLLGEYPRIAAVFDYMNDDPIKEKFDLSIKGLRNAARYAEIGWDLVGMESMWKEFEAAAFPNYVHEAIKKFNQAIDYGQEAVGKSDMASRTADSLIKELEKMRALEDKINLKKLLGKE